MDQGAYVRLRDERDFLAERVRQLESVLLDCNWQPSDWGLTPNEGVVLNILALRRIATKDAVMIALYGTDPDGGAHEKIVDVIVCHMRPKLKRQGIGIENVWGQGYRIDDASRLFLTQLWKAAA